MPISRGFSGGWKVALRKESVDRNTNLIESSRAANWSLSARRAWIEIIDYIIDYATDAVALRKESVDRNFARVGVGNADFGSLSARRAWIEICARLCTYIQRYVALRKESVDRNYDTC